MDDDKRDLTEDDDFDFFDDDFDEPVGVTTTKKKKRTAPKRASGMRPRSAPNWSRIAVAIAAALAVILVFGLVFRACADSRRTNSYRTYFETNVKGIVDDSHRQGQELDGLLNEPTDSDQAQIVARVEKLANDADDLVKQANDVKTPDAFKDTNLWLVTSLEYRRTGLNNLKRALAQALASGDSADEDAAKAAALAVQRLVASDVVYSDSFVYNAQQILKDQGVDGVTVPEGSDTQFVLDPELASPKNMALVLPRLQSGTPTGTSGKKTKVTGVHGLGLVSVTAEPEGIQLTGGSTTQLKASDDLAFKVTIENQGEGQEVQVPVTVELKSSEAEPQKYTATLDSIDPDSQESVLVPLSRPTPTFGVTLTATVTIGTVPGEKISSNNSAAYTIQVNL